MIPPDAAAEIASDEHQAYPQAFARLPDRRITHRTTFARVIEDFPSFTRAETGVIKAVVEVA